MDLGAGGLEAEDSAVDAGLVDMAATQEEAIAQEEVVATAATQEEAEGAEAAEVVGVTTRHLFS